MTDAADIGQKILNQLKWLKRMTVVLYIVVITVSVITFIKANDTLDALCALRGDLKHRVVQSQNFLKENPHGSPGIPEKFVRDGIKNQKQTIRALKPLDCPKGE